jgi:hypothetical protein
VKRLAVAALAAFGLAACMEVEQTSTTTAKPVGQTVKRDTKPWDSTPLAYESAKWSKGDKTSWENQIRNRQFGQHEHKRIYQ